MMRLLRFFALGALLLLGKRTLEQVEPERSELRVEVRASASDEEVESALNELVLVEEALHHGSPAHDPIVRSHLLTAVLPVARAAGESDEALLRRALELGMHRADPVVQKRLAFQGEQLVLARELRAPTRDELAAFYQRELARYRVTARVSFEHIPFSRSRRGERAGADAAELHARITRDALDDDELRALGDPTLLPRILEGLSAETIDARFGSGFGAAVFALPLARWSEPIASAYGYHLVRPRERIEARTQPLAEVEAKVRSDYESEARRDALARALRSLREKYRIEVVRSAP